MKSRLTIIILLVALVAVSTFGVFAYFNSAVETEGTISSGTLELALSSDGTTFSDSIVLPWDITGMAPGDTKAGTIWMKNTGSIAAKQVTFDWSNLLDNKEGVDLAEHIFLIEIYDSTDGGTNQIGYFVTAADKNNDKMVSLYELASLSNVTYPFDAVSGAVSPWLPAGGVQALYMKFQFDPNAGNEYQGIKLTYDLVVTAEQKAVFP